MDKDLLLYGYNDDISMGDDIDTEEDEAMPDGETMQPEDNEEDFE